MRSKSYLLTSAATAVVCAGLFAGMNAAFSSTTPTTFYGCQASSGAISKITTSTKLSCAVGYTKVSWNAVGPRGIPGPAGSASAPVLLTEPTDQARTFCLDGVLTCAKGNSTDAVPSAFVGLSSQHPAWTTGVPTGKYLVQYHTSVVNFGPSTTSDIFRCRIQTQGQTAPAQDTPWAYPFEIGGTSAVQLTNPGSAVSELSGEMIVDLTQPFYLSHPHVDIGVMCWHDNTLNPGVYYLDKGATLSIQPVS